MSGTQNSTYNQDQDSREHLFCIHAPLLPTFTINFGQCPFPLRVTKVYAICDSGDSFTYTLQRISGGTYTKGDTTNVNVTSSGVTKDLSAVEGTGWAFDDGDGVRCLISAVSGSGARNAIIEIWAFREVKDYGL